MTSEHLLLLPGMMCDERLWHHQLQNLDINCHVPRLTGSSDITSIATAVLDEAPSQFAAAGLSMGGIVLFEMLRQAPERITHVALIDTNPHADSTEKRTMRMDQIELALAGGLRELAVESLKPLYLAESNRDDEALLGTILDMAMSLGPQVFQDQSLALRNRRDNVDLLQKIGVPTTVICGAEDHLCPVAYHEFMAARIAGSKLVVIEDCGHMASMEQPDVVTQELDELLQIAATRGKQHDRH